MEFQIEQTPAHRWKWCLVGMRGETVASSDDDYPTQVQASAAATAFARLVTRASKSMLVDTCPAPGARLL